MDDMYESMADKGRKGDTYIGHLTGGEMVIPKALLDADDGYMRKLISGTMEELDIDSGQFTVGHENNSVNPETGQIEFGWGSWNPVKIVKRAVKKVGQSLGVVKKPPSGPSAAELKAVEEAKARVAAQEKRLNERETYLSEQKQSALRARKGRGGRYSLLGAEDRLG
jgi:hypothetical protein